MGSLAGALIGMGIAEQRPHMVHECGHVRNPKAAAAPGEQVGRILPVPHVGAEIHRSAPACRLHEIVAREARKQTAAAEEAIACRIKVGLL